MDKEISKKILLNLLDLGMDTSYYVPIVFTKEEYDSIVSEWQEEQDRKQKEQEEQERIEELMEQEQQAIIEQ